MRLTTQLIKGISRVLQKLLKYFNGTTISISFLLSESRVFPVILALDLNDSEFVIAVTSGSSLLYYHRLLVVC